MKVSALIAFAMLALTTVAFADGDNDGDHHHHHDVREVVINPGSDTVVHAFSHEAVRVSCQLSDDMNMLPACAVQFNQADASGRSCPTDFPYGVTVNNQFFGTCCFTTGADALERVQSLRASKSCR